MPLIILYGVMKMMAKSRQYNLYAVSLAYIYYMFDIPPVSIQPFEIILYIRFFSGDRRRDGGQLLRPTAGVEEYGECGSLNRGR